MFAVPSATSGPMLDVPSTILVADCPTPPTISLDDVSMDAPIGSIADATAPPISDAGGADGVAPTSEVVAGANDCADKAVATPPSWNLPTCPELIASNKVLLPRAALSLMTNSPRVSSAGTWSVPLGPRFTGPPTWNLVPANPGIRNLLRSSGSSL